MNTMKRFAIVSAAIGFCLALASGVKAQCGVSLKNNQLIPHNARFSDSSIRIGRPIQDPGPPTKEDEVADIVGLWDVQFLADDMVVDEGFDQYHSDGTEILNDTPPPAAGNVCLGVYQHTGGRSLKLKHPSWIYDPTNTFVIGTATILEQITVDKKGNSFAGTFTVQLKDLNGGSLGPDLTGDLKGTRIRPE